MTYETKNKLLHHLNLMKSIGYEYHDLIDLINVDTSNKLQLPNNMDLLKNACENCFLCELSKSRKNVVFGEGNTNAEILFVGEAPGATEDEMGRPFVGRAGELLTKMIENVLGIKREDVYITNIIKCRPANNRLATINETNTCMPYLFKQIELINPKLIVPLGETAYRYLTKEETPISKIRGQVMDYQNRLLIPTYHPSFLLRNPSSKKEAYFDMLKIKDVMEL